MFSALKARVDVPKELLLQTALSFFMRVCAALAGFVVSVVISRYLGVEEAGYYFLAFSIVMFLSSISRVGLDNTVIRFIGVAAPQDDWGAVRDVIQKVFLVASTISVTVACFVYILASPVSLYLFNKPELSSTLKAMAPGIVGLSLFTLIALGLQGLRRVIASVFTLNIAVNLLLVVSILLLGLSNSKDVALAYSIATFATVLIGIYFFYFKLSVGVGCIKWRELFKSCLPLWIVVIMQQIVQWSGQFIAAGWAGPEQISQLAVAQRTAMLVAFILMALNLVVAPRFADMYKQGKFKELEKLSLTSVKLMVLFSLPIVLLMLVFPEHFMGLFGDGFAEGAVFLQILVIGQFINVATGSVGYLLTMSGHEKDFRNTVLFSGPIAIALAFLLVPIYGAIGSAIATSVAIATQNLIALYWVKKRLGFNTLVVWR